MITKLVIEHIASDPNWRGGKPFVVGRYIKVQYIVELYQHGWSVEDIAAGHDLTLSQVHAALAYYYDHKAEIDQAIDEDKAREDKMIQQGIMSSAQDLIERLKSRTAQDDIENES